MSSFEKSSKALQALNVNSVGAEVLNYLEAFQADAENFETEARNAISLIDEELRSTKLAINHLQDALTDPAVSEEIVKARAEERVAAEVLRQGQAGGQGPADGGGQAKDEPASAG